MSIKSVATGLAAVLLAATTVQAATWAKGKTGNWDDTSINGWNESYPNGIGAVAQYGGVNSAGTAKTTLNVSDVTLGTLQMPVNTRTGNWTIEASGGNVLTMEVASGNASIYSNASSGSALTINPSIVAKSNLSITATNFDNQENRVTINGSITGTANVSLTTGNGGNNGSSYMTLSTVNNAGTLSVAGDKRQTALTTIATIGSNVTTLTKGGTSTLKLTGANSFSGDTTVDRGVVVVAANGALSSGDVFLRPATSNITSGLPTLTFDSALVPTAGIIDAISDDAILTLRRSKSGSTYYYSQLLFNVTGATEKVAGLVFEDFDGTVLASFDSGIFDRTTASQNGIDFTKWFSTSGNVGAIQVVPEPATMALLGLGGVMALLRRRRQA